MHACAVHSSFSSLAAAAAGPSAVGAAKREKRAKTFLRVIHEFIFIYTFAVGWM
jgi:hypothetical protein